MNLQPGYYKITLNGKVEFIKVYYVDKTLFVDRYFHTAMYLEVFVKDMENYEVGEIVKLRELPTIKKAKLTVEFTDEEDDNFEAHFTDIWNFKKFLEEYENVGGKLNFKKR